MSRDRPRPPSLSALPGAPRSNRGGKSSAAPPRGGPARAISALIPAVGGTAFRRFGFVQSSIISRWSEIVGARYAGLSVPESIRFPRVADGAGGRDRGVLTILAHGAHAPMLQHAAPVIIERVNRFFGYAAVVRLTIRQGSPPASKAARQPLIRHMTAEEQRARIEGLGPMLGDSLRMIEDDELRAVLEAMACGMAHTPDNPSTASISTASITVRGRVR